MPKANRFARQTPTETTHPEFKNQRFHFRVCPQDTSPLFRLPLELREQIYHHVLPRSVERPPPPWKQAEQVGEYQRESSDDSSDNSASDSSDSASETTTPAPKTPSQQKWYGTTQPDQPSFWHRGDLVLLRLSRRVANEALPLFYLHNTFDLVIDGSDPHLQMTFSCPVSTSTNPSPHTICTKKLSQCRRDNLQLIRSWNVTIPTHYAAQPPSLRDLGDKVEIVETWNTQWRVFQRMFPAVRGRADLEDALAEEWFGQQCVQMSEERRDYRGEVVKRLGRWVGMVGRGVRGVAFSFEGYPDWMGLDLGADAMLVRGCWGVIPQWLAYRVVGWEW